MIVTLDGTRLDGTFAGHGSLRSLIEQVRRDFAGQRLIVSVSVNGERFVEDVLEARLAAPVAPEDRVSLESAAGHELAAEALRDIADRIAQAGEDLPAIADKLNRGDSTGALEDFGRFVLTWQTCQKTVIQCCDVLRTDLTRHSYAGATLREHLATLAAKLRETRDALDARDFVLLADQINYELPQLCADWRDLLNAVADSLPNDSAPAGA